MLDVLEDPSWENNEDKDEQYVFYVKMKGDYYRYISEVLNDEGSDDKSGELRQTRTNCSVCVYIIGCILASSHIPSLAQAITF